MTGQSFIVCGVGETGSTIAFLLADKRKRVTVLDNNKELLQKFEQIKNIDTICGNCLEDDVLKQAGIEKAFGLFSTLPEDRDNVFLALSAKRLNGELKIVSRSEDEETTRKLKLVGANKAVNQSNVEGMRIASEMLRPNVVKFLDHLLHSKDIFTTYRKIKIPPESPSKGISIKDLDIAKRTGVAVIAVRKISGRIIYSPKAKQKIEEGDSLIVFATDEETGIINEILAKGINRKRKRGIFRKI